MELFSVRPMTEKDVKQIAAIEKLVFPTPWSEAAISAELRDNVLANYLVVAGEDDRVLGYCGVWKILDEGHITNVAVHPDYQGHHLGRVLMKAMIQWSKENEINHLTLEVRPSNESALKLYKRFGFEVAGRRKAYYEDNREDALILWLHFKEEQSESGKEI